MKAEIAGRLTAFQDLGYLKELCYDKRSQGFVIWIFDFSQSVWAIVVFNANIISSPRARTQSTHNIVAPRIDLVLELISKANFATNNIGHHFFNIILWNDFSLNSLF